MNKDTTVIFFIIAYTLSGIGVGLIIRTWMNTVYPFTSLGDAYFVLLVGCCLVIPLSVIGFCQVVKLAREGYTMTITKKEDNTE